MKNTCKYCLRADTLKEPHSQMCPVTRYGKDFLKGEEITRKAIIQICKDHRTDWELYDLQKFLEKGL